MEALHEYDFFTYLYEGKTKVAFDKPQEYWLDFHNKRLTLFYTLPLKTPLKVKGTAMLEVGDPEYFVAINFIKNAEVHLDGAPAGCTATYRPPRELDAQTMAILGSIPADQRDLPPDLVQAASRADQRHQHQVPEMKRRTLLLAAITRRGVRRRRARGEESVRDRHAGNGKLWLRRAARSVLHVDRIASGALLPRADLRPVDAEAGSARRLAAACAQLRLRRLPRGRPRSRQGGDHVLPARFRRNGATRRAHLVCGGVGAGGERHPVRGGRCHRPAADRDGDHVRDRLGRDHQLRSDRARRRLAAVDEVVRRGASPSSPRRATADARSRPRSRHS